ncbi:hypothetical protein EC991_005514 [Linnemannia zychae]|nr:hypothetical protein EC991_005514 [Linnemannia zychae]
MVYARSSPTSFSSSPPTSSAALSEHKPVPAAQSKVHDLARRFSAISKQSAAENNNSNSLGLPFNQRGRSGSFGRTEGSKISGLLNKFAEPKSTSVTGSARATAVKDDKPPQRDAEKQVQTQVETTAKPAAHEHEQIAAVPEEGRNDVEKEIESTLNVTDVLSDRVLQMDLVDVPLSNNNNKELDELAKTAVIVTREEVEKPVNIASATIEEGEQKVEDVEQEQQKLEQQFQQQKQVPSLLNDDDDSKGAVLTP